MEYWEEIAKARLSKTYLAEMRACLRQGYFGGYSDEWLVSPDGVMRMNLQLFGRMLDSETHVMPWIERAFPLTGCTVLEIGCGTGSSTVAIAKIAKRVLAWEIAPKGVDAARARLGHFRLGNVELSLLPADWIATAVERLANVEFHFVYLHAVIEHLKIGERIWLLRALWDALPAGGAICVYETPNRLNMYDWHSSWRPFTEWLPPDLACLYYGDGRSKFLSGHLPFAIKKYSEFNPTIEEALYRHGRGASFHEFDIAIGLHRMKIIADCTTAIGRQVWNRNDTYIALLRQMLEKYHPEVPAGFASPSLDLVIQKT